MSTVLLGQVWPLEMPPTPKAVLVSLADQANDQGVCWPAVGSICRRTCLSERAVQNAIKWLQDSGVLMLRREQGRATTYQLNPEAFGKATPDLFTAPARRAPPQQVRPRTSCTTPPQQVHPAPAAGAGDPRTSCTQNHKETTKEPSKRKASGTFDAAQVVLPSWLDRELWLRWVKDRKDRRKGITEQAALEQLQQLDQYRADGHSPESVIRHCIAGGYQGLFPPNKRESKQAPAVDMSRWWGSIDGIEAMGAELDVPRGTSPQETASFEARVWVAAGDGPWWDDSKATTYRLAKQIRDTEGAPA